jgi:hypothetical protein
MWHYASHKLRSIGLQGIFAGWSLSFVKDAFGSAVFFATFETIKSQAYYTYVAKYYGTRTRDTLLEKAIVMPNENDDRPVIRPHYTLEPIFLLLAGISASITSQLIMHPLTEMQDVHYRRLEALDQQVTRPSKIVSRYYHAYQETLAQCKTLAKTAGGWRKYLYRDFLMGTVRQVPSTSAGLIVFELVRRKYAFENEEVVIEREGARILLT